MPSHKQAGHTTVLTKKTANIVKKTLAMQEPSTHALTFKIILEALHALHFVWKVSITLAISDIEPVVALMQCRLWRQVPT